MLDLDAKVFLACNYQIPDDEKDRFVARIVESYHKVKAAVLTAEIEAITQYWVLSDSHPMFSAVVECNLCSNCSLERGAEDCRLAYVGRKGGYIGLCGHAMDLMPDAVLDTFLAIRLAHVRALCGTQRHDVLRRASAEQLLPEAKAIAANWGFDVAAYDAWVDDNQDRLVRCPQPASAETQGEE